MDHDEYSIDDINDGFTLDVSDLTPSPAETRFSAVIFDMDGTLTDVESPWRYVHDRLGIWDDAAGPIADQWLMGEFSYEEFCAKELELWNRGGVKLLDIHRILDEIEIRAEAAEVLPALGRAGIRIAILSTGFKHTAARIIAAVPEVPGVIAFTNDLGQGPNGITAKLNVSADRNAPHSKTGFVRQLSRVIWQLPLERIFGVSDHELDRPFLELCGGHLFVKRPEDLLLLTELVI